MNEKQKDQFDSILEYDFDFNRYVSERLKEIDDLDERRFAKSVLLEGLGKVINTMEQRYRQLEQRVYQEIEIEKGHYVVGSTIIQKKNYDPVNDSLYPVDSDDLDVKALSQKLSCDEMQFIETVYLKADHNTCLKFISEKKRMAYLTADIGRQVIWIAMRPADRYKKSVGHLYQLFQDNSIPWETVNTAYLDKFFDVFIDWRSYQGDKDSIIKDFNLDSATIDWNEYRPALCRGIIPLWNIQMIQFGSKDFILPCIDGIYYEHEFSLEDKNIKDGYLIESNDDILEIRHEETRIVIKSDLAAFDKWTAVRIIQGESQRSLGYDAPVLTNRKHDSFIQRYANKTKTQLMTKADLFRRIMEMDIRDYIEVVGYEICSNKRQFPSIPKMNWFIQDDLFPIESRKTLLLKFAAKTPEYYLNDDIVRFVISQLQMEISEYDCVGVIV